MASPANFSLIFVRREPFDIDRYIDAALAAVADLKQRGQDHLIPVDGLPESVESALRDAIGQPHRRQASGGAA